jgi:fatty acid desaturase
MRVTDERSGCDSLLRFVTAEELRRFSEIESGPLARKTLATWALILGTLWLWAATQNPVVLAAGFVVVSACQHALFLLAHEGAHQCVARRKWLNDLLSDALFAAPIFYSTEAYRAGHLPHHTHLGVHRLDLEHRTWVLLRGRHFARLLVETLSGGKALLAIARLTPDKVGARRAPSRYLAGVLLTNGALFAWCAALGVPLAYFYLWLLPFLTLTQLLLIVRAVAEHQPLSYARRESPNEGVDLTPALTRTFAANALERFLFAPVGAHHHEHHLMPGVPFSQLPRLHATLRERGYFDSHPDDVQSSYCSLLRRMIAARAETPSEGIPAEVSCPRERP